ncbi:hypothetical protein DICVIV_04219 [Dictyocaulus viviparus]|uniref:Uncharacterized protein n=1 Tax=Dictyocaulus viviparus TaxID=29172 RepID=A0A0D8XYG3_DICVI|nr:hypothetical protein DICVIV_04219 [Dictyocaulus viviparus]
MAFEIDLIDLITLERACKKICFEAYCDQITAILLSSEDDRDEYNKYLSELGPLMFRDSQIPILRRRRSTELL